MDEWMGRRTFETHFIRSTRMSRPNKARRMAEPACSSNVPAKLRDFLLDVKG